ncbi:Sybindin-like protein [Aureobasidium subglaciale]|nr:Sybindin-like protein [Aureobasidium subglaciale]KAI5276113.1 Sybindin-like protein [Aureobasidium subglaciale]
MQGSLTASLADFSTHRCLGPRQQDSLSSTAELERNRHPERESPDVPLTCVSRVVFALLVINKAGGLIYNRNFAPGLQQLSSNDYLILAGTFHGIHAISRSLSPVAPPPAPPGNRANHATGIQSLESSHFRLTCFQTPTGTKFLVFTSPEQPNTDQIARRCYDIYADYVMANPFYSLEMPIRVDKFDRALAAYLVRP